MFSLPITDVRQSAAARCTCLVSATCFAVATDVQHLRRSFTRSGVADDVQTPMLSRLGRHGSFTPHGLSAHSLFTSEVGEYAGQYVKTADKALCDEIKANGRLFSKDSYTHRYVRRFCCTWYVGARVGRRPWWFLPGRREVPPPPGPIFEA